MKNKEKLPSNKKTFVGPSRIHGNGIIAKQNIKKGKIVFLIKGKMVHWKPSMPLPNDSEMWVGFDQQTWINPRGLARYVNHSSNPNCGIKGRVTVCSIKNIKRGEEITIDYSITEGYTPWKMKDYNGNGERKDIHSIQFLPLKIYRKYLPYIPNYFQKVYNEYHHLKTKR